MSKSNVLAAIATITLTTGCAQIEAAKQVQAERDKHEQIIIDSKTPTLNLD